MKDSITIAEVIGTDQVIQIDACKATLINNSSAAISVYIGQRDTAHSIPVGGGITIGLGHPDVVDRSTVKINFNGAVTKSLTIARVYIQNS